MAAIGIPVCPTLFANRPARQTDPAKYKYPYLLGGLPINRDHQVWQIDISYVPLRNGFLYLVAIIDVHSRCIVGWDISNTMEDEWVVGCVKQAISRYGAPEIINPDQGSQFTSDEYIDYIKSLKTVKISMDGKGRATDNAHIERFFRIIKHDIIYLHFRKTDRSYSRFALSSLPFMVPNGLTPRLEEYLRSNGIFRRLETTFRILKTLSNHSRPSHGQATSSNR